MALQFPNEKLPLRIQGCLLSTFPKARRFVICVTNMKLIVNRFLFLLPPLEREEVGGNISYKYSD